MVLFGGLDSHDHALGDTWVWEGTTWAKQAPAASPPARYGPSMAYDAATGNVVLFGGFGRNGMQSGTWIWNGATWTRQFPKTSPPARYAASMGYDAPTGHVVLFSGSDLNGLLSGTWTWGSG